MISKILKISMLCLAMIALLSLTTPKKLLPILLVIPFVIVFSVLYLSARLCLDFLGGRRERPFGAAAFRPRVVASLLAGYPVLLLVLQSIGQLSLRDACIAGAIFVVAYFYATKLSAEPAA